MRLRLCDGLRTRSDIWSMPCLFDDNGPGDVQYMRERIFRGYRRLLRTVQTFFVRWTLRNVSAFDTARLDGGLLCSVGSRLRRHHEAAKRQVYILRDGLRSREWNMFHSRDGRPPNDYRMPGGVREECGRCVHSLPDIDRGMLGKL